MTIIFIQCAVVLAQVHDFDICFLRVGQLGSFSASFLVNSVRTPYPRRASPEDECRSICVFVFRAFKIYSTSSLVYLPIEHSLLPCFDEKHDATPSVSFQSVCVQYTARQIYHRKRATSIDANHKDLEAYPQLDCWLRIVGISNKGVISIRERTGDSFDRLYRSADDIIKGE